jgi:hypothetical protein
VVSSDGEQSQPPATETKAAAADEKAGGKKKKKAEKERRFRSIRESGATEFADYWVFSKVTFLF